MFVPILHFEKVNLFKGLKVYRRSSREHLKMTFMYSLKLQTFNACYRYTENSYGRPDEVDDDRNIVMKRVE